MALLVPFEGKLTDRRGDVTVGLLALSGVAIAAGSLIALFISESSSLFGFSESGYETPMIAAIAAEAVAILLLTPVAVQRFGRLLSARRQPRRPRAGSGHGQPAAVRH